MFWSFSARRIRAISDCPMAAIRSPNAGAEHPVDQLDQHGAAPVLPDLVEQPKIRAQNQIPFGRQRQRLEQVLFLVAQLRRSIAGTLMVLPRAEPPGSSG